MVWIKQEGCGCARCGATPCDDGCVCAFDEVGEGSISSSNVYDVSGEFTYETDIGINFCPGAIGRYCRLVVYADGVEVYDSGCVTGPCFGGWPVTVTIPAGTELIVADVYVACSGSGGAEHDWDYHLKCLP